MAKNALSYIDSFLNLAEDEKKLLQQHLQIMTSGPRQILTHIGEAEKHIYFIQQGIVRKYFLKGNSEVTVQLTMEGGLVTASSSFLSGSPADYFLETLEKTTLSFLTLSALESLYAYSDNFERMGRLIALELLIAKEKFEISRMIHSPRERFFNLLKEKPGLVERVPQKYIASLLDIKPETLSRYKKFVHAESEK